MTFPWQFVIWTDILGALMILILACLCLFSSLDLLKKKRDKHFYHYLFFLCLTLVLFAISRSFGHIVKQALLFSNQEETWRLISPFSGAINSITFILAFSFGLYFDRSRKIYNELEEHKSRLTRLVTNRSKKVHSSNKLLRQQISERTRTEKELERTISEFSAVMDTIDYGVLFMDNHFQVRIANRAFQKMWHIPSSFVEGHRSFRELMSFNRHNDIYDVDEEDFEDFMDEREARVRQGSIPPMELRRRDGMILQYQCIVLPDDWRMLTYFDLTELKKTQEKLAQSQKMEALGLMAGGVAHDLNNILTGVVAYPDMLLLKLPEESSMRKPLETIKASGQRAAKVVEDMLTIARGAATKQEIHCLNNLIKEYLKSPEGVKILSRHRSIRIKTALADDLLNISCSPIHIKKCLMNLLINSAESIEKDGSILIETKNQYVSKPVSKNHYLKAGEYVVLNICDNGKGIGEEDLKHIFEPFYSKKAMGKSGTGLGLTIVWNTVKEHGGTISVNSNEQGTCFELYFPVSREQLSSTTVTDYGSHLQGHGEFILVVD
ncbi:MAG: ATP-binding protein, partial [Thermodesulfobacteriota bacterium]